MFKKTSLTPYQIHIIQDKGTDKPFTHPYDTKTVNGTYLCRCCGLALFRADNKFKSHCGWPSFDDAIKNAVAKQPDPDGHRIEIICNRCKAHLGHVFMGEGFTPLNIRHCVNATSIDFVNDIKVLDTEEAIFAAGCFWGVEYWFTKLKGVLKTEVGYSGGYLDNPTYEQVCTGHTGHLEAIRILFDPTHISYKELVQYFFEIHNFGQQDGQGPDKGSQYLSHIFYYNDDQKSQANNVISTLEKNYQVATKLSPVQPFWTAEDYHQQYYEKNQHQPYCHWYKKIF